MAVVLRLKRFGTKKKPFWRVIVADRKSPRDGRFIEEIGYYDTKTDPSTISIKMDRAQYWLKTGAIPSQTVKSLLKKATIKSS